MVPVLPALKGETRRRVAPVLPVCEGDNEARLYLRLWENWGNSAQRRGPPMGGFSPVLCLFSAPFRQF